MYCWKCGTKIADESAFCAACGSGVQLPASKHRESLQPGASPHVGTVPANDKEGGTSQHAPQSIHGRGTLPTHAEAPDLYAGFWRRAAAFLIDCLVLCVPYAVLQAIARIYPAVVLVEILLIWLYYALFESSNLRATPGKLALSLAVVDTQGERISFWRATGRYLCRFLSFIILMVGYFMAGWTQHKQCLHDMLADTYVVRKKGLDPTLGHGLVDERRPRSATASVAIGLACFLVIAGLSAVGRVGYADYAARSQVRESVFKTTPLQNAIEGYVAKNHSRPHDVHAMGMTTPALAGAPFIRNVRVEDGDIIITFAHDANPAIADKYFALAPAVDGNGVVVWHCMAASIDPRYVPPDCPTQGALLSLSLPVGYARPSRPSDPNDIKGWEAYISSIVEANMGNITKQPYAYFVPTADDPANRASVAKVRDQLSEVVAATVLPGNMVAAAGPSSATTAQVLEAAFRNASPGSFQGVVILFIGDQADELAVRAAVVPSGATFKFAQM